MSKQREAIAAERLADLKLKAALASTNYQVTSEYGKSNDTSTGDQNLWNQLKAEEATEEQAKRKNQPAFKIMSQQWSRSVANLQETSGTSLPDVAVELPMTDKPVGDVQKAFNDFLDLARSRNIVFSRDGQNRLILYMGTMSRTSRTIEGVEYRVKSDDINTWIAADRRLVELSAYSDAERAELLEEDVVSSVEQSADELKAAAEQEWSKFPLWHAWEESLESGFGIKDLTDRIRRIVCDEFVRANLSPYVAESFNEIRRRLVAREIFPARPDGEPALTLDERMAAATENYDLSNPVQKKAWCHEMGRLRALLGDR
jgi:hypothetical protein